MSRNGKKLIIALVILAIIGGGYYWSVIIKGKKAEPESHSPNITLGNLESSELIRIEVPGIVLEKTGETWQLLYLDGIIPPGELDQRQIRNLADSLARIWIERIVDEEAQDLSVYGLDDPSAWAMLTDSSGKKAVYYLGNITPSRNSYYFMEEGDEKIYSVFAFTADSLRFSIDSIRQRLLFPNFELWDLAQLRIEGTIEGTTEGTEDSIVIEIRPESVLPYLASSFSTHILSSPYLLPRGTNTEALNLLISGLKNLTIDRFIDQSIDQSIEDVPLSLAPYGLDKPTRIFLQAGGYSLNLLIGNPINGNRYAKLEDGRHVFTLAGLESLVNAKPFPLIDKFALLVNIMSADHLSISGAERTLNVDLLNSSDQNHDSAFFINGKKAEEESFKDFYETVIGLTIEAEHPGTAGPQSAALQAGNDPEITIEYRLNNPPGGRASITLLPYNRDFYALRQEGAVEFLISRNQVRRIFEAADAVLYD